MIPFKVEMSATPKRSYSICGLERTFIAELTCNEREFVIFGMGPNIYPEEKKEIISVDRDTEIVVFLTVPVYVKNVVNMLEEGFLLAYGDSYIAWMPAVFLATGGVVCNKRVLSTGRTIHFIKRIDKDKIKIYYEDGTADFVQISLGQVDKIQLKTLGTFKFCLGLLERITCVTSCNETCWLGTSHGNVLSVQPSELIDIYSLSINDPIKQLLANKTSDRLSFCVLLYQSGNIAIYHLKKKTITKHLPGRFTVLNEKFDVIPSSDENVTLLVGDRDGNLTNLEINPYSGDMWTDRVIRGHTSNRITVIKFIENLTHNRIYYGTAMGTLHYYNMTETPDLLALSSGITFSEYTELPSFTGRSQPHILHKYCVGYGHTIRRDPFKNKPYKFLQTRLFSNQSCEILCRFGDQECCLWLLDYSSPRRQMLSIKADISGKKSKFTIVQVIVMEKHILIQFANDTAELHRYNPETRTTVPMMNVKTRGRITAALVASGMRRGENLLIIAYLDGIIVSDLIAAFGSRNQIWQAYEAKLNLNGSYIVSMAKTRFNMGVACLMLSANGRIYLVAPNTFLQCAKSVALCTHREDLTRQIGNGHSLVETSKGTLVVGWRGNILNIFCHKEDTYMRGDIPLTAVTHVISLPTVYPQGIAVSQQIDLQTWKPTDKLIIYMKGYQNEKRGVFQKICPIVEPQDDTCLTHTNTITAVEVVAYPEKRSQALLTGDRDGIFCVWLACPPHLLYINKTNLLMSYKLNGAINCICSTMYMVAVGTSQGEITLFAKSPESPDLVNRIPFKLKQSIVKILPFPNSAAHVSNSSPEFLVFLSNGKVRLLRSETGLVYTYETRFTRNKKIAQLDTGYKTAECVLTGKPDDYHLLCLGTDNVLRRVHIRPSIVDKTTLNWKVSAFKICYLMDMIVIILGCPDGHAFIAVYHTKKYRYFNIDRLHKHQIVDVNCTLNVVACPNTEICFATLDVSGMLIVRKFLLKNGRGYRDPKPQHWQCPVPSPQKIVFSDIEGDVFVFGKGYASRSFSDRPKSTVPTEFEQYNALTQKFNQMSRLKELS